MIKTNLKCLKIAMLWLAAAVVSGCAAIGDEQPTVDSEVEADQVQRYPDVILTPDLLYDILLGEIARQRGEPDVSVEALTRAAEKSRDARLAAKATVTAVNARDYDAALPPATLWSELQPDAIAPRELLGQIYLGRGDFEQAMSNYRSVIANSGDGIGAAYRRIAETMSRNDDPNRLLDEFDALIALNPGVADAWYSKAFLASRAGDAEVSEAALDQALVLRPGWEDAALAKLAFLNGRDDLDGARQLANTLFDHNRTASRFRSQYARTLAGEGQLEQALEQYETIIDYEPENAEALYAAGLLKMRDREWNEAGGYFSRALKIQSDNDQLRLYLADVSFNTENYDRAIDWLDEITDPELYLDTEFTRASVIAGRDGVDAGIAQLDTLDLSGEEDLVRRVLQKEQILRQADQLERAKAVLDEAMEQFPDNPELLYSRGLITAQLKMVQQHEQDMRRLIAQDPENAHAYNALGYTLADLTDRHTEALALIEKANSLKENDPFILDSMGWVNFRLGKPEVALEYLQRALGLRQDPEIAAHLGEVLWTLGKKRQARSVWREAVRADPDNRVLKETIDRLTK